MIARLILAALVLVSMPAKAQLGFMQAAPVLLGAPTNYGVTWNPADKDASVTLSNGDRTATGTSGSSGLVRATSFKSTGKWSFILRCLAPGTDPTTYTWIGLAPASLPVANRPGDAAGSFSWISNFYQLFRTRLFFSSAPGDPRDWPGCIFNVDSMLIAVDLDNALFWTRTNNTGDWNNIPGADPDTGVSGLAFPVALTFPTTIAAWVGNASGTAQVSELCAADACALVTRPSTFPWWTP
jgi:hypothetical protein